MSTKKSFTYYDVDVDGVTKQFPRVSKFCKSIDNERLIGWCSKVERELVLKTANALYADCIGSESLTALAFSKILLERLGKSRASQRILASAADVGSMTHHMIEWKIRKDAGQQVGKAPRLEGQAVETYKKLVAWVDNAKLKPLLIEQTVWSVTHKYAGTMDLFCEIPGMVDYPVVTDWKTSRAIYMEAAMQVACYARALEEMGHGKGVGALIVQIPKEVGKEGTHLLIPPDALEKYFKLAMGAKALWVAQREWEKAAGVEEVKEEEAA